MTQSTLDPGIAGRTDDRSRSARLAALAPGIAVSIIWVCTLVSTLFAPDMVSGSAHEHLPLAAITGWVWAASSTGFVLLAGRAPARERDAWTWIGQLVAVAAIWAATATVAVFAPSMVTGSDPTRIPIAALVAPVAAMVATAMVCLYTAVNGSSRSDSR